jgi:serine/threonine protein kinase
MREPVVAHIFRQLMEALAFLHGRNLFHRDLKTENMLVSREVGMALHVILSKHQSMTPSMFCVTNLTPPGSDNPTWRTGATRSRSRTSVGGCTS